MKVTNPWLRLYAEFATDPKVQMMQEADQRRLVMLFCLRCSNGDETLHETEVAFQLRVSLEEWKRSKAIFESKGFIDSDGNLLNWNERQYVSDSSTARVRAYRDKMKQEGNVSVTPPDTETDTEQKKKKEQKKPPQAAAFVPPDWIGTEVWKAFLEMRKKKRAPATDRACNLIVSKLLKLSAKGNDPSEVLDQSIRNSWTDVYPIKDNEHGNRSTSRKQSVVERVEEHIRANRAARESTVIEGELADP